MKRLRVVHAPTFLSFAASWLLGVFAAGSAGAKVRRAPGSFPDSPGKTPREHPRRPQIRYRVPTCQSIRYRDLDRDAVGRQLCLAINRLKASLLPR